MGISFAFVYIVTGYFNSTPVTFLHFYVNIYTINESDLMFACFLLKAEWKCVNNRVGLTTLFGHPL